MARSTALRCLVVILLIQLVHSWNVEEWGDPYLDPRFRRLPKSCTYGKDQWECPSHAECEGVVKGICYCMNNYTNPDRPGTDTSKTGLRCLSREKATISNGDPRWKETFLPCTVNCTASLAECSKETGACVCSVGHIGDPASRYNGCKAVEGGGVKVSTPLVGNILSVLVALLIFKNA